MGIENEIGLSGEISPENTPAPTLNTTLSDFETGDTSEWTDATNVTVTNSDPYAGTYSGVFTNSTAPKIQNEIGQPTTVGIAFKVTQDTSSNYPRYWIQDTTGNQTMSILRRFGGNFQYYENNSVVDTGITWQLNQWYFVKMDNINFGTSTYDIVVDDSTGTNVLTVSGVTFYDSPTSLDQFRVQTDADCIVHADELGYE